MSLDILALIIQTATLIFAGGFAYAQIKKDLEYVRKEIDERINPQIQKLQDIVRNNERRITILETKGELEGYVKAESPLKITEKGLKLLQLSGGKEFVDEHEEMLLEALEEYNTDTPYDIQENSQQVMLDLDDEELERSVKTCAYDNGVSTELIYGLMGIYLRDKALKHKQSSNIF